jgi:hypothetical protein
LTANGKTGRKEATWAPVKAGAAAFSRAVSDDNTRLAANRLQLTTQNAKAAKIPVFAVVATPKEGCGRTTSTSAKNSAIALRQNAIN